MSLEIIIRVFGVKLYGFVENVLKSLAKIWKLILNHYLCTRHQNFFVSIC